MTSLRSRMIFNISPPKSGTTAMFYCLARCDDVAKPKVKEPRFFARRVGPDIGYLPPRLNLDGRFHLGFEWFEGLYSREAAYRLDFSTYYAATEMTPQLMRGYDGDARLMMILRDPVERMLSHYYHYIKTGVAMPPIGYLKQPNTALSKYLMRFADYKNIYNRFADQFGEDRICLIDFRDLSAQPEHVTQQVRQFLDLSDFEFNPSGAEKNAAGRARSVLLQRMLSGRHAQFLSQLAPFSNEHLLAFRRRIVAWNTVQTKNPEVEVDIRATLYRQLAPQYEFLKQIFGDQELRDAA